MKDKKAIIATFHNVPNYGAVLQTVAMSSTLKKYFSVVEILDYQQLELMKSKKYVSCESLKGFIQSLYSISSYTQKNSKFNIFIKKNMSLTCKYSSGSPIDVDNIFLGSDQIWNPNITKGFDPVYFGFLNCIKRPKIMSYAASMGNDNLTCDSNEFFKLLKNIDFIGVRESNLKQFINENNSNKAELVLDPTLLLTKEEWTKLFNVKPSQNNYLLVYNLAGNDALTNYAIQTSKALKLNLIEIMGIRRRVKGKRFAHNRIYNAGPSEFLSWIYNANFVMTDSFHGTVFSVIFEKDFITYPHKNRSSRILTLLNYFNLSTRMTSEIDSSFKYNINYESISLKLIELRKSSLDFIELSVNNKTEITEEHII